MKKLCLLSGSLFTYFVAAAQTITGTATPDDKIVSERVFIHTDKSSCVAGDTIWFKAYLFDGYQQGSASTNLFVELADEQGHLIFRQKLPVFDGVTSGFFEVGDSLQHGFYFLRAYTPQMILSGAKNVSSKIIAVLNIGYIPDKYIHQAATEYKMQFYPEGGNIITGLTNTIAFKLSDQYGNGLNIPVLISNAAGDTVTYINSTSGGMGTFSFKPIGSEKYIAEIKTTAGETKKFDLPIVQKTGVLLNIAENSKGKIYLVQKSPDLLNNAKAELLGIMFDNIVFRQPLRFENNESTGVIPLVNLPAGVLHVSVIDESENVLAFRPVIISKTEIQAKVFLKNDTVSFSPKAKNVFSIRLPDTTEGNFSVSVTALNSSNVVLENNSIINSVLLNSESGLPAIGQKVFTGTDKTQNDLLTLTGHWHQSQPKSRKETVIDNYISVTGKVFRYGSKKNVTKGTILMYLQTKDSLNTFLKVPVNSDGVVKLEGLVFDDSARFNYQPDDKKMGKIEITIDPPKENKPFPFTISGDFMSPADRILITKPEAKKELTGAKKYIEKTKENYKLLEGVTVRATRKRPIDVLNKRYTSGLFSSMGNVKVLDLVNDPPHGGQNIFQYLQGRVAGLRIDWKGGNNYSLTTSRAMSMTGGMIPVQIFLNETEVDVSTLLSISVKDIALVKYFPAGSNTMIGFGLSGKLAIYTKKIEDYTPAELGQYNFFFVEGYTPTKEFTVPDYSKGIYTNEDKRQTLYWNPDMYITSDTREVKVRFFNSDNATKFKVVIQGYTYDGRFIDFEKIIE